MAEKSPWYSTTAPLIRFMRFLNLIEDGAVKLSLSGFMLWVTTLNNIHAIALTHDSAQMLFGSITHIAGMVGHAVKRWQNRGTNG